MTLILRHTCNEPDGPVERSVSKLIFTPENLQKFWDKAKQFPTLYGSEVKSAQDFYNLFIYSEGDSLKSKGLFYVIDDFVGVFYVTDITLTEASVHYSFFDKRHKGRVGLVKLMIKYIMDTYKFRRINATVPLYTTKYVRHFIPKVGFELEGRKRKSAYYKGEWYDTLLYGMTSEDVYRPIKEIADGNEHRN